MITKFQKNQKLLTRQKKPKKEKKIRLAKRKNEESAEAVDIKKETAVVILKLCVIKHWKNFVLCK
jgi:hypothetical protein